MVFNILIQRNNSPITKMGKNITLIKTLTGSLRNETDIINPEILLEATQDDLRTANYLTISEFGRKYFIEEIESVRTNMYIIRAHVDVLDSFISQIKGNNAVVLRQENDFNLLLNDGVFKCQQNPRISLRDFPSGLGQFNYILIAGGSTN